jgi:starvation-inducible DNA-binding protein
LGLKQLQVALLTRKEIAMAAKNTARNSNAQMAKHLVNVLSDTYLLMIKTHGYHWNVAGPLFPQLHPFLETQYTELFAAADDVAERIRAIGFPAPGSTEAFKHHTAVKEAGERPLSATAMIKDLIASHEQTCERIEEARAFADEINDQGSEDLMIARLRAHEKDLWMLRAQTQAAAA